MSVEQDIADDLMSSFEEHYDELQYSLNRLSHHPDNAELINVTFRAIHTIKGNAAIMQLHELVDFTHAMEETIGAIRNGNFEPTGKICDLLLTGTDKLKDLHQYYLYDRPCEDIDQEMFSTHFIGISEANSPIEAETRAKAFYKAIYPEIEDPNNNTDIDCDEEKASDHRIFLVCTEEQFSDLDFFKDLAMQVDRKSFFWQERTERLVYLGVKICSLSTYIQVDMAQLVAAIYIHDVGMAFLPHELINKQAKLNAMELKRLKKHVGWSHNMLVRIPDWQDAASMVLQHHEHEDGSGYPNGLRSEQLCDGAKIIAILDAFYAMTNLRSDRNHRRSVLRAISEINACTSTQFKEYWVEVFNQVIRNEVKNGAL